jgi:catalase
MLMWIMSDRAIPRSFRFMEGFGVHTFRLVNAEGRSTYVKFHWKPKSGMQSVMWNEAVKINGADPDFHRRDLWDAITQGDPPEWELGLQLFDDDFADSFAFDVLDPTKIIPEEELPIRMVGRLVLDRVVDNFFAETEQVAFCTQNVVPGIDFTNDPLLQGRNFSYLDTQLKRLGGPNFTHLPINAPKCPVAHFQQDGHMAIQNPTTRANYEPNSWPADTGGPREDPRRGFTSFSEEVTGAKRRLRPESFADHYSQARQFWISQTEVEQAHIVSAFVFELSKVARIDIRERMVAGLCNVHEELARAVSDGLGLASLPDRMPPAREPVTDLAPSAALSIVRNGPNSFAGRKLGVLLGENADARIVASVEAEAKSRNITVEIIAPTVGGVTASSGERISADQRLDGAPSVLYDAVLIAAGDDGAQVLRDAPAGRDFACDAFAHCKFIGFTAEVTALFNAAGLAGAALDDGVTKIAKPTDVAAFLDRCTELRYWPRQAALH